jgi:threonine dehydratase
MTGSCLGIDDVRAARERIAPYVHRTPVLTSRQLDERLGCRLFFKGEVFQRTGSFKARGAFSRLTLLSTADRQRGVVAFSSGNHGQAIALAGRELGIRTTIVMPHDAPSPKVEATRGYGATVIQYNRQTESREEIARGLVAEQGAILVPPFDDDMVIAGQGTVALELLEEVPELEILVAPCGGGGLLSGLILAGRAMRPALLLYGVEPEAGDDMRRSLEAHRPIAIPLPATIADSLQTLQPAARTLAIVESGVEAILTVSDLELRRAMATAASRLKLVVEPGGSAGLAAVLHGKVPNVHGRRVGVVLSGGNVDPERFGALVAGV